MIRPEIHELAALGRFPREEEATKEQVIKIEDALPKIQGPVTDEEARILAALFPPEGSTFGLAWRLVHLIETAPGWPLPDVLDADPGNEWIGILRTALENTLRAEPCRCATSAEFKGNDATDYADMHLREVSADHRTWVFRYECAETGALWELRYPNSEHHGGGSPVMIRTAAPRPQASRG